MFSIRSKTIILNVAAISVSVIAISIIGIVSTANFAHTSTENQLILLAESGKHNLNNYFRSVEQSLNTLSELITDDVKSLSDIKTELDDHVARADDLFGHFAYNTTGVFDYYYRFDPEITNLTGEKGFWYINESKTDKPDFVSHEVTDITTHTCKWFYDTKAAGKPIWLDPYITDTIDAYVISYNVPIYTNNNQFIGVAGIEIDYKTLGVQIKDIKIYKNGYAFLVENKTGSIVCHPELDLAGKSAEERPPVPGALFKALKNGERHVKYTYNKVSKHAYWLELSNGMSIVVAVPSSEISATWQSILIQVIVASNIIIAAFILFSILYTRRITKPLKELTVACEEINNGNYEVKLEKKSNDEIGVLTTTVNKLVNHLGEYISDLSSLAYVDSLTSTSNKGSFDIKVHELQTRIDSGEKVEFAIAIFDCDNLKVINDKYGHDKGNIYLRNSAHLIMHVFENSQVFRLGGDEFAVILEGDNYKNRDKLRDTFLDMSKEICAFAKNEYEQVRVSVGVAAYDPQIDSSVQDVIIHADHLMYSNKRSRKKGK